MLETVYALQTSSLEEFRDFNGVLSVVHRETSGCHHLVAPSSPRSSPFRYQIPLPRHHSNQRFLRVITTKKCRLCRMTIKFFFCEKL